MELIVYPDRSVPLVTVEFAVRMGPFRETPDLNGLTHFYEHLFFRENQATLNDAEYLRDIGQKGVSYNGTTREEVVEFFLTALSPHFDILIRYLRDAALYPAFTNEQFSSEREVVIDEINRQDSNPYSALNNEMNRLLFGAQAHRKNAGGSVAALRAATPEKMREFQRRFIVPQDSAIIVTGDIDPETAYRRTVELFGDWPRSPVSFAREPQPQIAPLARNAASIVEGPVENVIVEFGWQGPSIGKDDAATYAADVFSFILERPGSRFHRALVDSGLTTASNFGYYTQRNVGPINLIAQISPEKTRAALRAIRAEIARFNSTDYFTDQELEDAKAALAADDLFSREKLTEYAHTLGFWWSTTGADYFRGYQTNLRRVSREDIDRYLKTYIQGRPFAVVVLLSPDAQRQLQLRPEELTQP
jgi:zinc protease